MLQLISIRMLSVAALLVGLAIGPVVAQTQIPAACPAAPIEVVRSRGGVIDNLGSVREIPDLCRIIRSGETGQYYFGIWKTDWPGAGEAYPAIKSVILGGLDARASFVTRSVPGWQWTDTFVNEGVQYLEVDGRPYRTLRIMHE